MALIALLACVSVASLQEGKTVTITGKGIPLGSVIRQVVEQTHLKVSVDGLEKLPVVIKVENMAAKPFLETLAEAVGGAWFKDGEGVVLRRDDSLQAASKAEERQELEKWISQAIANVTKNLEGSNNWSDDAIAKKIAEAAARIKKIEEKPGLNEEWVHVGNGYSPANLLLVEALRKLPRKAFTEIEQGGRVVYSTSANRFQRQLPYEPQAARAFMQARAKMLAGAKKLPNGPYHRVYTGFPHDQDATGEVGKVLLRITNQQSGRNRYMNLDVVIADTKGQVLGNAATSLYANPSSAKAIELPKGKVTLSPTALALSRATVRGNQHPLAREYDVAYPSFPWKFDDETKKVESVLRDPVGQEPTNFIVGDTFFQMAEKLKKGIIAYVPDTTAMLALGRVGGATADFERLYGDAGQSGCRIEVRDVLFAKTEGFNPYGMEFVDRQALAGLIEKIRTQNFLRFKDISDYIIQRGRGITTYDLDYRYLMACSPTITSQLAQLQPVALRAYASLGMKIDSIPVGSREIPMSQWPSVVRDEFGKLIERGYFRFYGEKMTELEQQEPTEVYDENMLSQVVLTLVASNQEAAYAIDAAGDGRFLYAYQLGSRQNPINASFNRGFSGPRTFESMRKAEIKSLNLTFTVRRQQNNESVNVIPMNYLSRGTYAYDGTGGLPSVREVLLIGNDAVQVADFSKSFQDQVRSAATQKGPLYSPDQVGYKPVIPPQP